MTENYRYPNLSQSVWILVLLLILMLVLGISFGILEGVTNFPLSNHPAVLALINLIAFGLVLTRGFKRANTKLREICPLVPVRLSLLFPMALTIIGTFSLQFEMESWLRYFPSPREWYPEWYTEFLYNLVVASNDLVVVPIWVIVVSFVILPLTEELLVRGLILRGFLSRYSARKAVLASALLPGLISHDPSNFIGPTMLGILFAWWFIQTRSMLPCFLGRAFYGVLFVAYIVLGQLEIYPFWWNLVGVILTPLGVWLLIRQFRKSSDTVPEDVSGDRSDQL
jgi:membrane protease YdiL (CAAX protease family)